MKCRMKSALRGGLRGAICWRKGFALHADSHSLSEIRISD
jgi:hypothetical protein